MDQQLISMITKYDPNEEKYICQHVSLEEDIYIKEIINANKNKISIMETTQVITSGLSFNIEWNNQDINFNPDAPIYDGKSIKEWIVIYLESWGPNVYVDGFMVNVSMTFALIPNVIGTASFNSSAPLNTDPLIEIPLPNTYSIIDAKTKKVYSGSNFTSFPISILRYWGFDIQTTPDMFITISTDLIRNPKPHFQYDYSNNFTNNESKISFKGGVIHEIHHGLGFAQNITETSPTTAFATVFNVSLFQNSKIPSTRDEYLEEDRERIGASNSDEIDHAEYKDISLSFFGACIVPISNDSADHLKQTDIIGPQLGIMTPVSVVGGAPWSFNDGTGLACVGWPLSNVCCYSGKTKIKVRNKETNDVQYLEVSKIISKKYDVYDVNNKIFVPIKINIVMKPTRLFFLIKKDLLGKDQPFEDLYITAGHPVFYQNKLILAKNIPGAIKVRVPPEKVFSICTNTYTLIYANNIPVSTWRYESWMKKVSNSRIIWSDNKI